MLKILKYQLEVWTADDSTNCWICWYISESVRKRRDCSDFVEKLIFVYLSNNLIVDLIFTVLRMSFLCQIWIQWIINFWFVIKSFFNWVKSYLSLHFRVTHIRYWFWLCCINSFFVWILLIWSRFWWTFWWNIKKFICRNWTFIVMLRFTRKSSKAAWIFRLTKRSHSLQF